MNTTDVCFQHLFHGCNRGEQCKFSHQLEHRHFADTVPITVRAAICSESRRVCRYHFANSACTKGSKCSHHHLLTVGMLANQGSYHHWSAKHPNRSAVAVTVASSQQCALVPAAAAATTVARPTGPSLSSVQAQLNEVTKLLEADRRQREQEKLQALQQQFDRFTLQQELRESEERLRREQQQNEQRLKDNIEANAQIFMLGLKQNQERQAAKNATNLLQLRMQMQAERESDRHQIEQRVSQVEVQHADAAKSQTLVVAGGWWPGYGHCVHGVRFGRYCSLCGCYV